MSKAEETTLDYYEASRRRDIAAGVLQSMIIARTPETDLTVLASLAVAMTDSLLAELSK